MRRIMRAGEGLYLGDRSDDAHRRGASRIRAPRAGTNLDVSDINFTPASARDAASGLLGYISLTIAGTLRLDGIAVRRTRAGRLTLAFPAPTSSSGRRRELVRPIDAAARERIERAVLGAVESELD